MFMTWERSLTLFLISVIGPNATGFTIYFEWKKYSEWYNDLFTKMGKFGIRKMDKNLTG